MVLYISTPTQSWYKFMFILSLLFTCLCNAQVMFPAEETIDQNATLSTQEPAQKPISEPTLNTTTSSGQSPSQPVSQTQQPSAVTCFQLQKTTMCPNQEGGILFTTAQYNDTQTFDLFIDQRAANASKYISEFQAGYQCPAFSGQGTRFHQSLICSMLIDASTTLCSTTVRVNPNIVPLCKETCTSAITSLQDIFKSPICSQSPSSASLENRNTTMSAFMSFCSRQPMSSAVGGKCLNGSAQLGEASTCGFVTTQEAATYCITNAFDPCCASVPKSTTPPPTKNNSATARQLALPTLTPYSSKKNVLFIVVFAVVGVVILIFGASLSHFGIKRMHARQMKMAQESYLASLKSKKPRKHNDHFDYNMGKSSANDYSMKWQETLMNGGGQRRKSGGPRGLFPQDSNALLYPLSVESGGLNSFANTSSNLRSLDSLRDASHSNSPSNHSRSSTIVRDDQDSETNSPVELSNNQQILSYTQPPSPTPATTSQYTALNDRFMRAFATYIPKMPDEIPLSIGDTILVYQAYDDGWALGRNVSTSVEGVFPIACAESTSYIPPDEISTLPRNVDSRVVSLIGSSVNGN
ncbi:hypothetical protein QVD99_000463 [Batrachochytrium dendrobatidis]|nr:hypothetical protein O5D80_008039 [Batrachochytrium dendrobatidis]KAK5672986.1 hypothetical protein QVD99_000463 [Batrachochytrium dendrobatidis]